MPKIVDHDEKRSEILLKSFDLFARKGYRSVSMRELAREVGVSTGSLYHYFQSKDDLFQQMFAHMSKRDVMRATSGVPADTPSDKRVDILFRFLEENEEYFQNVILMILDYYRDDASPSARAFLTETIDYYRSSVAEQLGIKGLGLEHHLFSFVIGVIMQRMFDASSGSFDSFGNFLKTLKVALDLQIP